MIKFKIIIKLFKTQKMQKIGSNFKIFIKKNKIKLTVLQTIYPKQQINLNPHFKS